MFFCFHLTQSHPFFRIFFVFRSSLIFLCAKAQRLDTMSLLQPNEVFVPLCTVLNLSSTFFLAYYDLPRVYQLRCSHHSKYL